MDVIGFLMGICFKSLNFFDFKLISFRMLFYVKKKSDYDYIGQIFYYLKKNGFDEMYIFVSYEFMLFFFFFKRGRE